MTQTISPAPVVDHYADSAARFARDTANHVMIVLHDDGLYRHLRFKAPGTGSYWFDLVTWPNRLSFSGGVDGYTFSREQDMFEFFRSHRSAGYSINPDYWSEKVDAGREAVRAYSEDLLRELISDHLDDVADNYAPGLRAAVEAELLSKDNHSGADLAYEDGARQVLADFSYAPAGDRAEGIVRAVARSDGGVSARLVNQRVGGAQLTTNMALTELVGAGLLTINDEGLYALAVKDAADRCGKFEFRDTHEWRLQDFSWSFLWACQAIRWGVAQYDAYIAATVEACDATPQGAGNAG